MKIFNRKKAIKEIANSKFPNFVLTLEESSINYGLEQAIQIINNNIKEDGLESYEQLDHYWQKRYNDLLLHIIKIL